MSKCQAVQEMRKAFQSLGDKGLIFKITVDMKERTWMAESVNLKGILTGGSLSDNIPDMIEDAIMTYFDIPARYCISTPLRSNIDDEIFDQLYAKQKSSKAKDGTCVVFAPGLSMAGAMSTPVAAKVVIVKSRNLTKKKSLQSHTKPTR